MLVLQIDALAPRRVSESSSHVMDRLLSVLLVEMDGISSDMASSPVFIIATTSHKNILDPAILRPGSVAVVGIPVVCPYR